MMNKKILLFIDSLGAGGAQQQIVTLAKVLKKHGHCVTLVIYHDNYQLIDALNVCDVPVCLVKKYGKLDASFLFRLLKVIMEIKPDVIVSYLTMPNMWARLCSIFIRGPVVITSERNIDLTKSFIKVFIEKILYRLSDSIVVNARSIQNILINDVGISSSKIRIIYNGLDVEYYKYDDMLDVDHYQKEFDSYGKTLLLLPGRIEEQKNHNCLIDALSRLESDVTENLKILFAGNIFNKELYDDLVSRIENKNLHGNIIFLGVRDDMKQLYSMADIVILPSLWEGLPNVVIEAMSCSRVVLASDVSDNPLFIENDVNGFLFRNNDSKDLADKLKAILSLGESDKKLIGDRARERICKMCSLDSFYNNYYNLFV